MQSCELKDNYNKKIDEIIDFFKIQKELWTSHLDIEKEDGKFMYNVILTIIGIIIAILTLLLTFEIVQKDKIPIIIIGILLLLAIHMICHQIITQKRNNHIINESIKFNFLFGFLQSLKILPYEVDLSRLTDKIKKYYHIRSIFSSEESIFKTFYSEIDDCCNEINTEILEKEENSKLPK